MFQKVDPKSLKENVFSLIGDRWLLVTAGSRERLNTMTASWGAWGYFGAAMWPRSTSAPIDTPTSF